jgi:hypothetical protein
MKMIMWGIHVFTCNLLKERKIIKPVLGIYNHRNSLGWLCKFPNKAEQDIYEDLESLQVKLLKQEPFTALSKMFLPRTEIEIASPMDLQGTEGDQTGKYSGLNISIWICALRSAQTIKEFIMSLRGVHILKKWYRYCEKHVLVFGNHSKDKVSLLSFRTKLKTCSTIMQPFDSDSFEIKIDNCCS